MKFFFDENLPKRLANAIAALDNQHEIKHIVDNDWAGAKDVDWLRRLGTAREWNVISCDAFSKTKEEKREITERARCTFVFAGGFVEQPIWIQAYKVIQRWPVVLDAAARARAGQVYRVRLNSNDLEDFTNKYL